MTKQEYNGWYNYETWLVKLWIDNEQGSCNYWRDEAIAELEHAEADKVFSREENAALALSKALREHHELALPEVQGFAADLLGAAMSEVNWHEIAEHLIDEAVQAKP